MPLAVLNAGYSSAKDYLGLLVDTFDVPFHRYSGMKQKNTNTTWENGVKNRVALMSANRKIKNTANKMIQSAVKKERPAPQPGSLRLFACHFKARFFCCPNLFLLSGQSISDLSTVLILASLLPGIPCIPLDQRIHLAGINTQQATKRNPVRRPGFACCA